MNHYLFYNGQWLPNDKPIITADNRGFRYGDGLFETFKVVDGNIQLATYHFERLFTGLQLLQFELPAYFTAEYLARQVTELCARNKHKIARVRLTVCRGNGGLYDPENHFPNCIIQGWPLQQTGWPLNENGLVIDIYADAKKSIDAFSNIKSNNYLPYLVAALHAKKHHWNDALILNTAGRVCDATIASLFIIKDNIVYTPALTEGCVAGVCRRFLKEHLPAAGFKIQETTISIKAIHEADEVFLTNAIQGIRWVQCCGDIKYGNRLTTAIYTALLKKLF
jgi:branched-chain amino acid aminotransferase